MFSICQNCSTKIIFKTVKFCPNCGNDLDKNASNNELSSVFSEKNNHIFKQKVRYFLSSNINSIKNILNSDSSLKSLSEDNNESKEKILHLFSSQINSITNYFKTDSYPVFNEYYSNYSHMINTVLDYKESDSYFDSSLPELINILLENTSLTYLSKEVEYPSSKNIIQKILEVYNDTISQIEETHPSIPYQGFRFSKQENKKIILGCLSLFNEEREQFDYLVQQLINKTNELSNASHALLKFKSTSDENFADFILDVGAGAAFAINPLLGVSNLARRYLSNKESEQEFKDYLRYFDQVFNEYTEIWALITQEFSSMLKIQLEILQEELIIPLINFLSSYLDEIQKVELISKDIIHQMSAKLDL